MASLHIPLTDQVSLRDLLATMPDTARSGIKRGFSIVATIPESAYPDLLKATLESAHQQRPKSEGLATKLNIKVGDATSAIAALAMFSSIAASRSETLEKLLQEMIDAGVIAAADKPSLVRILPAINNIQPELKKTFSTQMIANAVLPSFDGFEAVLDVRIGDLESGGFAAPVAIAFLDTDARDHRLWFQMTKEDVETLITQLNSLLTRFKEAEALIGKWPATSGGGD